MHLLRSLLFTLLPATMAGAQTVDFTPVIARWITAFEAKKFGPNNPVTAGELSTAIYAKHLALVVGKMGPGGKTHKQALDLMVAKALQKPGPSATQSLLMIAGTGIGSDFYRPDCYAVRAIGHEALAATTDLGTLHFVQRTASGDRLAWAPRELRLEYRAAALRVLGESQRAVFRPLLEAQLLDIDNLVRLAAAEAIADLGRSESLAVTRRALALEPNPMVRGALVRTIGKLLSRETAPEEAAKAGQSLIAEYGQGNPRLDALLLATFEQHRDRRVTPILIDTLARAESGDTTPLMRHRAWLLLRAMTGMSLRWDAAPWREWWREHGASYELKSDPLPAIELVGTRENFFGIPVYGREVIFVLDTSGSMDENFIAKRKREQTDESRLDRAKRELAATVLRLPLGSRYQVMTFASFVRTWSRGSIAPGPKSHKALLSCLDRMKADGGTELYRGVLQALGATRIQYGHTEKNWRRATDEIFILSDGEPSGSVSNPSKILQAIEAANRYRQVRINTIFLGDKEDRGATFMRQLARQNNGACRVVGPQ